METETVQMIIEGNLSTDLIGVRAGHERVLMAVNDEVVVLTPTQATDLARHLNVLASAATR